MNDSTAPTWVKICGINDVASAVRVADLRPNAVGLNFYSGTPRAVSVDVARQIVEALPASVTPVGVFVNHTVEKIVRICRRCRLQTVQLHGDEPPQMLAELQKRLPKASLIRAVRLGREDAGLLNKYLEECTSADVSLCACLVDARVEGKYGGTGQRPPWESLFADVRPDGWPPLILAGGLTADNVAEAIRRVRPWGVDVAGGVESSPARKDLRQVARFISSAREAFRAVAASDDRR